MNNTSVNDLTIVYESQPNHSDTMILWKGITENARLKKDIGPGKPFGFFIKNTSNKIKGGCSGYIFYGCLYLDFLWVDQSLRGKKLGTKLMENTEALAKENKCKFISVNTMDFEALDFYKKLGFIVEFERQGFEKDSKMYFLRKNL